MACRVFMLLRRLKEITAINIMALMDNQAVYESDDVVEFYHEQSDSAEVFIKCFLTVFC